MTVELTVTSITVQPDINAAQIVITPTFSSNGGQTAPIISISKNGGNIAPDVLKNVDIEVPTKTSEITNDSGFITNADLEPYATNEALQSVSEAVTAIEEELPNKADLVNGLVPASQLPSYVDDVIEVANFAALPVTGESGKIYITQDDNLTYRWSGTGYAEISKSLALGETNSTAYRGDRGKTAYDHSQITGNPHGATASEVGASPLGHNHSGEGINPDYIVLDAEYTDITMLALPVGSLFYNVDQLAWLLKTTANTYLNLGEENTYIAKNGDLVTHLEGQVTYVTSGGGNLDVMTLASSANGKIDALLTQDVLHTGNGRGMYCFGGKVRTFPYSNVIKSTDNENTWVEGAELYLCSEAGRYSTTKEAAPAKCSIVGKITQRNGANISVSFRPFKALSVTDLSDVDGAATTVSSGDSFFIKVGNLWKTITESNFLSWFRGLSHTWSLIQDFAAGLKTNSITKRNGSGLYKLQDGGTEWHITKRFTPTGTFSSVGTAVTTTGGQLTSAMVGAKIGVGEDKRVITAFLTSNTCTVDSAFSQDYSGVVSGSWGVYSIASFIGVYLGETGFHTFLSDGRSFVKYNDGLFNSLSVAYDLTSPRYNIPKYNNIYTSSVMYRSAYDGAVEFYKNSTFGDKADIILSKLLCGTSYVSQLKIATTGVAITSISVEHTTNFPATGTILIGGVTSVNYTSKTATSLVFASTVIPAYAVGTAVLVTSAGSYVEANESGVKSGEKSMMNNVGGFMIKLTNKTGANSVKGTVVYASPTTDNAFTTNPVNGDMPFGIVYENGIADGAECWVVVSGIAEVLMENNEAATRSYIAYSSATTAGRIQVSASVPASTTHFREIGHTLESKTAGTNVLVKCVLHFN